MKRLRRAEFGQQDKCLGLAELAEAIGEGRPHFPSPDFTLHVTELTLAIQAAGPDGASLRPSTRFDPPVRPSRSMAGTHDYRAWARLGPVPRMLSGLLRRFGARRA